MRNRSIAPRTGIAARSSIHHRATGLVAGLALGMAMLTGCSAQGSAVDCRADASCLITFDRTVDASASVLGVEARLVGVDGSMVTVEVAGEQVSLWLDEPATQVAGVAVNLERVNATEVEILVAPA